MVTVLSNIGMTLPMATTTRPPKPPCFSPNYSTHIGKSSVRVRASGAIKTLDYSPNIPSSNSDRIRRSGNYEPTLWDFDFIQSLHNDYLGEGYMKRSNELKNEIRKMINSTHAGDLEKLELIDNLQRLGVSYHFKDEIVQILRTIHQQRTCHRDSLYVTALKFRLLRQHGFHISQDVLNDFKDEKGHFKQSLCEDTKGLLQLYEASFLSTETESTLESANKFTMSHLNNYVKINHHEEDDNVTVALVRHALELPLHWMMLRAETRWYINIYDRIPNANPLLLEFAKLDFNIVQSTHQEELKNVSRWWKSSCLIKKLPFSRDRPVEAFLWTTGMMFEPQSNQYCRVMLTKVTAMATFIDDIYDVYGTYPELELFTHAVERMDLKAMEQLPDYMKICYLALFNIITEIAYEVLKEQGINVIPYLTKFWADMCKAHLLEARWYYNGHKPTLQEYMDNAWISVGAPIMLVNAFLFVTNPITKEALESLSKYPDIIRWCTTIVRLTDDLGTTSDEMKRGDVPKSIQSYMNEKGVSEEEAREHVKCCIKDKWKLINKAQRQNSLLSEAFIGVAVNIARTAHSIYQYGDGHGIQNSESKNRISELFFEPIRLNT